jgi:hypothetical protein
MRTTVTIDPDVEALLRQAMQQSGESFKVTLNRAIQRGLADTIPKKNEKPFVVKPKAMGLKPGIDYSKINQLADELEVEDHLEVTRKLLKERSDNKQ